MMEPLDSPADKDERSELVSRLVGSLNGQMIDVERLVALYRPYLQSCAQQFLPAQLQGRLDGSDLVQETLLRGVAQYSQFKGTTEAEFAAWLKQILQNLVVDLVRHHTSDKRDVRREEPTLAFPPASDLSPSDHFKQQEDASRISAALKTLSEEQQLVIGLRSQGLSFEQIGERTGRTADAARMLWGRAVIRLGKMVQPPDSV